MYFLHWHHPEKCLIPFLLKAHEYFCGFKISYLVFRLFYVNAPRKTMIIFYLNCVYCMVSLIRTGKVCLIFVFPASRMIVWHRLKVYNCLLMNHYLQILENSHQVSATFSCFLFFQRETSLLFLPVFLCKNDFIF